ncbi:MAG: hypothetical protein RR332_00820, partial [Clostridiales bacterium]
MTIMIVLISTMVLLNLGSGYILVKDLLSHLAEIKAEPGNPKLQALNAIFQYFFSTLGISDYAISTILYTKTGWVSPRKLPGTLNTQCMLPVFITGIAYMIHTKVELITIVPCLVAQMAGALIGPRFAIKINIRSLKKLLSCSLFLAGGFILATLLGWLNIGGDALGFHGYQLAIAIPCFFLFGFVKAFGVGCFPLTMLLVFFLGLHPLVAYPLMMGAGALSSPIVASQFIFYDSYARRLTLFTSTLGLIGVFSAVSLIHHLDITLLQWLIAFVVIFAAVDMFRSARQQP